MNYFVLGTVTGQLKSKQISIKKEANDLASFFTSIIYFLVRTITQRNIKTKPK